MPTSPTALILGGTGSLWVSALHLARAGWSVIVTGREPSRMPGAAAEFGIRFVAAERDDEQATEALVGDGVDLLVDGQGYAPGQARALAALSRRCGGTAYLSAKAVYVDACGHHLNSPGGAHFDAPVTEAGPTMAWQAQEVRSAEGYGAGKAESERLLAEHGERVSVLRPSKIHGPWVRQVRSAPVLDLVAPRGGATGGSRGRDPVSVAGPDVVESTTSAEVLARAVLACARAPRARVLNVADADPRPAGELAREVWRAAGCSPVPEVVPADPREAPDAARLPWRVAMVLDTSALSALGVSLPTFAETAWMEVEWVLRQRRSQAS